MRKLVLTAVLASVVAVPAMAQKPMAWTPEIGIKSNYSVTTVNDQDITTIGLPGGNGIFGFGGVSGLYGVVPVSDAFAVEPSLGVADLSIGGNSITTANFSARLLYSAWRGLYVGAGPTMSLFRQSGSQESIFGVNAGVGYRFHITGNLVGRGEVFYEKTQKSDFLGDESVSSYGAMLGLGLTPSAVEGSSAGQDGALWQWVFGLQSGYQHSSGDFGDYTSLNFPGSQGGITAGEAPLPGVAPMFVQIPVTKRVALEPSVAFSSIDFDGSGKVSTYAVGLRANYAVNKTLYAGVSGDYQGYGGDLDADATTGFGLEFGARFPIVSGFSGRTELSWRRFNGDENFIGDFDTTALSFAIMAPLK